MGQILFIRETIIFIENTWKNNLNYIVFVKELKFIFYILQLNQIPIKLEPPFSFFDTGVQQHGDYNSTENLHDNKVSCNKIKIHRQRSF